MQTKIASPLTGATRVIARGLGVMACGLGLLLAGGAAAQSPGTSIYLPSNITDDSTPTADQMATMPNRVVPIPPNALRAEMTFDTTNAVKVRVRGRDRHMDPKKDRKDYEKTIYLAPGVRIFSPDSMLMMSGALKGTYRTKFMIEPATGLLIQVWILTKKEMHTPDPKPADD
ncbi:MAG TPA: hypothetical protein VGN52_14940 [Burkholderiales bacterium]|jgi:hypothetical protein